MGDAGGELPDGLHLLPMPPLLLGRTLRGLGLLDAAHLVAQLRIGRLERRRALGHQPVEGTMPRPVQAGQHGDERQRGRREDDERRLRIPDARHDERERRRIRLDVPVPVHGAHLEHVRAGAQLRQADGARGREAGPHRTVHAP